MIINNQVIDVDYFDKKLKSAQTSPTNSRIKAASDFASKHRRGAIPRAKINNFLLNRPFRRLVAGRENAAVHKR